jgi:hypothetical protein
MLKYLQQSRTKPFIYLLLGMTRLQGLMLCLMVCLLRALSLT